jgi:glycosyltransferase involved in cell wall biosynthesis
MRIGIFYPVRFVDHGPAYACLSVAKGIHSPEFDVRVTGISSDLRDRPSFYRDTVPPSLQRYFYKLVPDAALARLAEHRYRFSLSRGDIAYIWPGTSLELVRMLKARGHRILIENINSHQRVAKRILDEEYEKLGIAADEKITDEAVDRETKTLAMADAVFSPSPFVTQSLIDSGVDRSRIMESSYGLRDGERAAGIDPKKFDGRRPTVLFAARIGVRKGIHKLLEYWERAKLDADLVIAGRIEPAVRSLLEPHLVRPGIRHIGFVDDLGKLMAESDIFVLPSLEEGSPLVTYMALGAGLPCIVTPMGGGGVVRHGESGLILEASDGAGWVDALRSLVGDCALRRRMAEAAWAGSERYLWPNTGKARRDMLLARFTEGTLS